MNEADALQQIAENIAHVMRGASSYARHWAARYNGPVYLVGSTLHSPTPRDCDIRVIVEDHEFAARFGHELVKRENPFRDRPEITSGMVVDFVTDGPTQRWIDDIAKIAANASRALRMNVDLQVWPESLWHRPYPPPIVLAAPSPKWFFMPERKTTDG